MMDQRVDIPCQVCLVTSTKGEIRPLWCRYQTEQGELIKINIDEVKQTGNTGNLFLSVRHTVKRENRCLFDDG